MGRTCVTGLLWVLLQLDWTWAQPGVGAQGGEARLLSVDVATAQRGSLKANLRYTGTTQPLRQATLRTRTEGLLLELRVDVGDPVREGQVLGQLDPTLLQSALLQAQAQVAAQESQVAQAQAQLSQARTQVEQARGNLFQQEADAERLGQLAQEGAVPAQQAEQARTAARTAAQALRSAEEQVRAQEQAVIAAQRQVEAQGSLVAQAQERLSYTQLLAPLSGVVLSRQADPGTFLNSGADVLTVADFSQVRVEFPLSELELGQVQVGQAVQIELDAFPGQSFSGQITRIAPAADPQARLIPIEVVIPNPDGRIGSGLLARVQLALPENQRVIVPESAIQQYQGSAAVFGVERQGESVRVVARPVQLGERRDGQVEVLSGLEVGDPFVVRSSTPLQDGQEVQLSVISTMPD
ncbi:efflux RND transporter periplasmic adaptor subunit [Synechococcus sp. Nb3U1]|uniref:efflux RND transporter periplasmic adaptor subunit n=1 Tax=Synechococcus sp. Nb3U1 TaxID=1914529 RepID=UPI001F1FAA5B|nr:efflux RND transporter periplasmic adaptor subunit [Synechococcus sp. Nb3U1]MCF2970408.1 efflux RND transporter periplasmic adaptor subunit [Synechococcus sp. Nb3U1]